MTTTDRARGRRDVVILDDMGAQVFAPMERRKDIEDLVDRVLTPMESRKDIEDLVDRVEEAVLSEIRRQGSALTSLVMPQPFEDVLGDSDFSGLEELSNALPPIASADALAALEAVIASEIQRREREGSPWRRPVV